MTGIPREREHLLEIFKIQVDDIILPWVADGVPMYWWVPMYWHGFLCLNSSPFLGIRHNLLHGTIYRVEMYYCIPITFNNPLKAFRIRNICMLYVKSEENYTKIDIIKNN